MTEAAKGISVTLKCHGGYDAPWVVFYGESAADVRDKIEAAEAVELYAVVGRAAELFKGVASAGATLGATPVSAPGVPAAPPVAPVVPATPAPTTAPASDTPPGLTPPSCIHGVKRYVANGKFGPFWGCPAPWKLPDGSTNPDKCKPQSVR